MIVFEKEFFNIKLTLKNVSFFYLITVERSTNALL